MNKKFLDTDESFPNSYHHRALKVVRNSTTCNFRITDPMKIDILALNMSKRIYEGGLYTNFAPSVVQEILSNHVLFLFPDICCHKQN